jgi:pimeloyl-ACP methyl ester carboxylesterase
VPERAVHTIKANGVALRVLEWAPPAWGRTALLLHGYMDAAATWQRVAAPLVEAGLRVLAPDLRGYGDSARAPEGSYYHFPDYVADVAGLVEAAAGPAPLLLVGHSMGGTISTLYAGAFPERVEKLALLEGLGPPDNDFDSMPDRMRRWIEQTSALRGERGRAARVVGTPADALRRLAANHPNVPREVLLAHLPELTADAGDGQVSWKADPLHKSVSPIPFFARGYIAFARRVRCPVLYFGGGKDGLQPADTDDRLGAFASLERFEIEGAGHMMHWTRADEVAVRLLRFFGA